MLKLLFKKWWVVLLQGVLLLLLGFYIFKNPDVVLVSVSIWFGLMVFGSGLLGIFSAFGDDDQEHRGLLILWSALTAFFGLVLLINLPAAMKILTILFGLWMLAGGIRIAAAGWRLKATEGFGWIVTLAGVASIIVAFMVMFNIGTGAVGISALIGLQILFVGIALVILALVKKRVAGKIRGKINELRET